MNGPPQRCTTNRCATLRQRALADWQGYDCTRSNRPLCALFDQRLLELACRDGEPGVTVEQLHEMFRNVQVGHMMANAYVRFMGQQSPHSLFPDSGPTLAAVCRMLHRQVFQPAGLWFAGRMRQPGEPGVTYGHGPHERDGLLAEQIEPELDRLYDGVIAGVDWENLSHWQVARRAASFLEWFFRIHPFHDGNGRVGRLMVRALLYRTQFQVIDAFPDESTQDGTAWRTRYRKGLEHAHRHACPTEADQYRIEGGRRVDPLSKLATALHECIEPRPVQDHEHVPPEWIRVVRLRKTAARAEAQVSEPDKDEAN